MHTPGPWTAAPQDGVPGNCFTAQVFGPDDREVAEITSREDAQEATDNATAIAATPDFMEAAALMTASEDSGGDLWWKGFEMLKAAYKKAGGRFPSMERV